MNVTKEMELKQLCRICAVDVSNDTGQHYLFENDAITDLGETFISCLGIQVNIQLISLISKNNFPFNQFFLKIAYERWISGSCL